MESKVTKAIKGGGVEKGQKESWDSLEEVENTKLWGRQE